MSPGRRRWSLVPLLQLLGGSLAVRLQTHQDSVNGTVGQSVLLPVSYTLDAASRFPLSVRWTFPNSPSSVITCTVHNCSLGAGGAPTNCSANCFPRPTLRGRAEFFPENGSLLLRALKLSDSGVYSVTFREPPQTRNITLTVHGEHPASPAETSEQQFPYWTIGVSSAVALLLLLLLICCLWHRGAARQKRRIIKQQQTSSVEEPHMAGTMVRDSTIIYARIGDSFDQPQPRQMPETIYATVTPPTPPGLETGLYQLVF